MIGLEPATWQSPSAGAVVLSWLMAAGTWKPTPLMVVALPGEELAVWQVPLLVGADVLLWDDFAALQNYYIRLPCWCRHGNGFLDLAGFVGLWQTNRHGHGSHGLRAHPGLVSPCHDPWV